VSRETTEARIAEQYAANAWKYHRGGCPECAAAARARHWGELCQTGAEARSVHAVAAAILADNKRLDRMPIPGQEPIF
jgi:hypothetical protein